MNAPARIARRPPGTAGAPAQRRTLWRLFLMLFLRGRSARGLNRQGAPRSIKSKLGFTLAMYALFGLFAMAFVRQSVFSLSVYLHGMSFVFLGMFVAASAGEVLFNKEEADILLHRPVSPRSLLWAKVSVLVQVSLWLGFAFNFAGLFVGAAVRDGGWWYPIAHGASTALAALFCTGCVVLIYQLCLRWFGRERLDGLMTTAQVLVAVVAVAGSQLVPHLIGRFGSGLNLTARYWWLCLLPPAWFAGFDDAIAGQGSGGAWVLASVGLTATVSVVGLSLGKLAGTYGEGLQSLGEATPSRPKPRPRRRRLNALVGAPPLRWWLRDSVSRASFLLTAAYLFRDRDVKLRIYPGMAPMLVLPFIFLFRDPGGEAGGFGVAFAGAYVGLIPLVGLDLLRYSQQWRAADLFRVAPLAGPAPLCHGARCAVLLLLTFPMVVIFGAFAWFVARDNAVVLMLIPGLLQLPIYALIPCMGGKAVPLSLPAEEAKSVGRGLSMIGVMFVSMALSGIAAFAWSHGWFGWLLLGEAGIAAGIYTMMRVSVSGARWKPME